MRWLLFIPSILSVFYSSAQEYFTGDLIIKMDAPEIWSDTVVLKNSDTTLVRDLLYSRKSNHFHLDSVPVGCYTVIITSWNKSVETPINLRKHRSVRIDLNSQYRPDHDTACFWEQMAIGDTLFIYSTIMGCFSYSAHQVRVVRQGNNYHFHMLHFGDTARMASIPREQMGDVFRSEKWYRKTGESRYFSTNRVDYTMVLKDRIVQFRWGGGCIPCYVDL